MLLHKLTPYTIILASASPRRRHLLQELGVEFISASVHDVDEQYPATLSKEEIPVYLAKLKAENYQNGLDANTILITADTIVWLNGEVLHKPENRRDAIEILNKLSGNKHEVITGVCLTSLYHKTGFYATTNVYFSQLTSEEVAYYVDSYKPYDKAGAYGIQEWIGYIGIEKIEGSYFNVMGLPVQKLYHELEKFVERIGKG